jgi:hypothetical protein
MVVHVEDEILSHDRQTNQTDITTCLFHEASLQIVVLRRTFQLFCAAISISPIWFPYSDRRQLSVVSCRLHAGLTGLAALLRRYTFPWGIDRAAVHGGRSYHPASQSNQLACTRAVRE